jgi:hypothetical protein
MPRSRATSHELTPFLQCIVFFICFTSGIVYDHIPPWLAFVKGPSREGSTIICIAGMFGCLILFLLGALVARLK